MRIVVLSDNTTINKELKAEHGLCIYFETESYKCLLDTGGSDLFIENAVKLNVDLSAVNYVFISHGHSDHIGGLVSFLNINQKAKVYLSENAISQRFFTNRYGHREIGLTDDLNGYLHRMVFVDNHTIVEDSIHVLPIKSTFYKKPKSNLHLLKDSGLGLEPDDFDHELAICFGTNVLQIYTGCAHKGLLNTLNEVNKQLEKPILRVFGGFHLSDTYFDNKYESDEEIDNIGAVLLKKYPHTEFITGHCTGENAYSRLHSLLGERMDKFHVGYQLTH